MRLGLASGTVEVCEWVGLQGLIPQGLGQVRGNHVYTPDSVHDPANCPSCVLGPLLIRISSLLARKLSVPP